MSGYEKGGAKGGAEIGAKIGDVSDTALWVAHYRGLEARRPDAAFRDPLATVLAGERGAALAAAMGNAPLMGWAMVMRTSALDRLVLRAVARGAETVLNLGAGLDTRPYRLSLPAGLRWVEVDFPGVVDLKNARLAGEKPVCALERVALDLTDREARRALLSREGARAGKIAVLTEGVLPYLAPADVGALAEDLRAVPQIQWWIQDYMDGKRPIDWGSKLAAAPFRFEPADWMAVFAAHGWRADDAASDGDGDIIAIEDEARRLRRWPPLTPRLIAIQVLRGLKAKLTGKAPRRYGGYVMLGRA